MEEFLRYSSPEDRGRNYSLFGIGRINNLRLRSSPPDLRKTCSRASLVRSSDRSLKPEIKDGEDLFLFEPKIDD